MFSAELEAKIREYERTFNDDFPTYPLALSRTNDETIKLIDRCLEEKKDVYELGFMTDDTDTLY